MYQQSNPGHTGLLDEKGNKPEAKDEDLRPTFEDVDVENMDAKAVFVEMERRRSVDAEWQARQFDKKVTALKTETELQKQEEERKVEVETIRTFGASKPDFNDLKNDIRRLYGAQMSVEQAYNYVKWEKIAKNVDSSEGRRSAMKASTTSKTNMNRKFNTIEEGVSAAFDEVVSNGGNFDG